MHRAILLVALAGVGCGTFKTAPAEARRATPRVHGIVLPGAPPTGDVFMDYIAYDRAHGRVWVPAGNTGSVDVLDATSDRVVRIEGFSTAEIERHGTKRTVGPSSVTVGDGVVYVGNRGDSSVCAIDAAALKKLGCVKLDAAPDGLAYVAAMHEVWVTTPRDKSIHIVDVARPDALAAKGRIRFEGEPEGFAVDDTRGLFYTNLEDADRTLVIDVKTHEIIHTWMPACGSDGPRGLALDEHLDFLFVACTDHVVVLDAGHDGKHLSSVVTGPGLDNIDYVARRRELFAAASRAATLTVARVDAHGTLTAVAVVPTAPGARNAVATEEGTAFLTDSPEGKILVVSPATNR